MHFQLAHKSLRWLLTLGAAALVAGCGVSAENAGDDGAQTPTPDESSTPTPSPSPTPEETPEPLEVSISTDSTTGVAPLTVELTPQVTGGTAPYDYAWTFGSAGDSTEEAPVFTFEDDGTYDVELTVTDADGQQADDTTQIVVDPKNLPDLRVDDFVAELSYFLDDYEPNDDEAYYLGSAPDYWNLYAYIDEREVTYQVVVANTGEANADGFYVDLFPAEDTAPNIGDAGVAYAGLSGLMSGDTVQINFVNENAAPGSRNAWATVDSTDDIEEAIEDNNIAGPIAFDVEADVDWFYLHQDAGYAIDAFLENLPADFDLVLYGPGNELLSASDNAGTTSESVGVSEAPVSGYYLIGVYGYDGAADSDSPYRLQVTAQ